MLDSPHFGRINILLFQIFYFQIANFLARQIMGKIEIDCDTLTDFRREGINFLECPKRNSEGWYIYDFCVDIYHLILDFLIVAHYCNTITV